MVTLLIGSFIAGVGVSAAIGFLKMKKQCPQKAAEKKVTKVVMVKMEKVCTKVGKIETTLTMLNGEVVKGPTIFGTVYFFNGHLYTEAMKVYESETKEWFEKDRPLTNDLGVTVRSSDVYRITFTYDPDYEIETEVKTTTEEETPVK